MKKIGHVVINMAMDRPWFQYFGCMLVGNREFVRKHLVATKRALRAILKADQICALEPERVARDLVAQGFIKSYDYAVQTMKDVPYGRWRQYDPEDAVRFCPCACMRRASSNQRRRRSSPGTPTGATSTSSRMS
jgi:NitT/TauT family transport system substrate-binding protein